jgi:DNA-binding transcriptional MerR regulator
VHDRQTSSDSTYIAAGNALDNAVGNDSNELGGQVSDRIIADDSKPIIRSNVASAQFKTREVVDLMDLSRRQLQYWAKTGLIEPSARTPGGHHRYSFDDLVALKATKRLIDAGVSVQKIRKSVRALQELLPQVGRPLSELVLVATGDVVLVFQDDTVFEAVSGQEWVFEVAEFEREVSAYRLRDRAQPASVDVNLDPDRSSSEIENDGIQGGMPAKPGPRGARSIDKNWSQTG